MRKICYFDLNPIKDDFRADKIHYRLMIVFETIEELFAEIEKFCSDFKDDGFEDNDYEIYMKSLKEKIGEETEEITSSLLEDSFYRVGLNGVYDDVTEEEDIFSRYITEIQIYNLKHTTSSYIIY